MKTNRVQSTVILVLTFQMNIYTTKKRGYRPKNRKQTRVNYHISLWPLKKMDTNLRDRNGGVLTTRAPCDRTTKTITLNQVTTNKTVNRVTSVKREHNISDQCNTYRITLTRHVSSSTSRMILWNTLGPGTKETIYL